jgi:hypothetical protein
MERDHFLPSIITAIVSDSEVVVDELRGVATGDILHNTKGNLLVGSIDIVEDLFEDCYVLTVITVSNVPGIVYEAEIGDELKILGSAMNEK